MKQNHHCAPNNLGAPNNLVKKTIRLVSLGLMIMVVGGFWVGVVLADTKNKLVLEGDFVQGALIFGQAPPGTELYYQGKAVRLSKKGRFLIGFGRDEGRKVVLDIRYPDGSQQQQKLSIHKRKYKTQHIKGLPRRMVTPGDADLKRIYQDAAAVKEARMINSERQDFEAGFEWPVKGIITGVYGSQRILNGKPRRPHFGIDIAAAKGTEVRATAAGIVTLAADLYFTGSTLIIEHGHGLNTTYSHLESMDVAKGDRIAKGQRIGTVGSTGRSTGPHLDFRLNLQGIRLDPKKILPPQ